MEAPEWASNGCRSAAAKNRVREIESRLADMAERFHLLNYGLAAIVMFVGVKMLIMDWYKIPIAAMLGVIFATLAASIVASLARPAPSAAG